LLDLRPRDAQPQGNEYALNPRPETPDTYDLATLSPKVIRIGPEIPDPKSPRTRILNSRFSVVNSLIFEVAVVITSISIGARLIPKA